MGVREGDLRVVRGLPRGRRSGVRGGVRRLMERHGAGEWTPEASALTVLVGLLLLVGLLMSFSASFVDAAETGDPFGVFVRQLGWAAIGVPTFLVASRLHPRVWRGLSWLLLAVSLVGLVAVLVPGVGVSAFGSTSWIGAGPFVAQPSELAKLASLLWIADVLARKRRSDPALSLPPRHVLVPAVPLLVIEALLLMLQPDLGTTIVLGLIVALVLFIEGLPLRHVALIAGVGAASALLLALVAPYRLRRITGWLDPEADPLGVGYQLLQARFALGSGGVFGVGLGSSRGKWSFIPTPETDFVFAIIGEELGLVGATFVLGLFAALLVLGLRVARDAPDAFTRTVAFAITGWLVGQAFVNVAAVTGVLPITGVTLPLISVGGSSMVSTLLALGILVAIARTDTPTRPEPARRQDRT